MRDPAHSLLLDPALPEWITPALIALTLSTFRQEKLTDQDAIEMLMSAGNLFSILSTPGPEDEEIKKEFVEEKTIRRAG